MYLSNTFITKPRMSSTQQVLLKKLRAGLHEQKTIEAAERRDYAAVCFQLLNELAESDEHIEKHEHADKHNHELHQKVCEKLKTAKEENLQLKKKMKEQQFEKDIAARGAEQMLKWYEDDDQSLRDEIERLSTANIHLQHELHELTEEKEDLRQKVGYTSVVLAESRRTIKTLAEEKDESERRWEKAYKELEAKLAKAKAALYVFDC